MWCWACSWLPFLVASSTWSLMSSRTGRMTWLKISRQRRSPKWAWCSSRVFSKDSRASLRISSFFSPIRLVKLRRIGNQSSFKVLRRIFSVVGGVFRAYWSVDFSLDEPGTDFCSLRNWLWMPYTGACLCMFSRSNWWSDYPWLYMYPSTMDGAPWSCLAHTLNKPRAFEEEAPAPFLENLLKQFTSSRKHSSRREKWLDTACSND